MITKREWLIQQKNSNSDKSLYELLSELNTKQEVDNPKPITKVPQEPTLEEIEAVFKGDDLTLANIQESKIWEYIVKDIENNRPQFFVRNLRNLLAKKLITQEHFNAIFLLLSQQVDDPNYQSKVWLTPAEQAGFDIVTTEEITEVFK